MIKEFKDFAIKGNVLDLAIAVVIGAAFGKIVTALVNDIVMPLIGIILGGRNFSTLTWTIGEAEIRYGAFIQSIVDFSIIALTIFLFVKFINRFKNKVDSFIKQELDEDGNDLGSSTEIEKGTEKIATISEEASLIKEETNEQTKVLLEIRDLLKDKKSNV
jgi:large conductance mechanosensitive channel